MTAPILSECVPEWQPDHAADQRIAAFRHFKGSIIRELSEERSLTVGDRVPRKQVCGSERTLHIEVHQWPARDRNDVHNNHRGPHTGIDSKAPISQKRSKRCALDRPTPLTVVCAVKQDVLDHPHPPGKRLQQ